MAELFLLAEAPPPAHARPTRAAAPGRGIQGHQAGGAHDHDRVNDDSGRASMDVDDDDDHAAAAAAAAAVMAAIASGGGRTPSGSGSGSGAMDVVDEDSGGSDAQGGEGGVPAPGEARSSSDEVNIQGA